MPSDGKSSYCLWQGELKIDRSQTFEVKVFATQHSSNHILFILSHFVYNKVNSSQATNSTLFKLILQLIFIK